MLAINRRAALAVRWLLLELNLSPPGCSYAIKLVVACWPLSFPVATFARGRAAVYCAALATGSCMQPPHADGEAIDGVHAVGAMAYMLDGEIALDGRGDERMRRRALA